MSQTNDILEYLQRGFSLTALEALEMFGCLRLAARINDLRNLGYPIETEILETENGKQIASYWLGKDDCQLQLEYDYAEHADWRT